MRLSATDIAEAVARAERSPALSGYHHRNHRVEIGGRVVLVRMPAPQQGLAVDVKLWPEDDVLALVARLCARVPRLLGVAEEPAALIQEFIDGDVVEERWPRGRALPTHLAGDVVEMFAALHRARRDELPPLPAHWPEDGHTDGFLRLLVDKTAEVLDRRDEQARAVHRALGVPADPLAPVRSAADALAVRSFVLCHCDVHRGNCIVRDGRTWFVDWELALFGDPVYDIAAHLHKSAVSAEEERRLLEESTARLSPAATVRLAEDVATYRRHERVKSALVDPIRYRRRAQDAPPGDPLRALLVDRLLAKLNDAAGIWDVRPWTRAQVADVLLG